MAQNDRVNELLISGARSYPKALAAPSVPTSLRPF